MESRTSTVADENRNMEARALAKLQSLIADALQSNGAAKYILLRIPVHGLKLGKPLGAIEKE